MISGSPFGLSVFRTEDPRLLTGEARFVEDLPAEGALHAAFVRSPVAHALLTGVRLEEARAMPGVVAALDAAGLGLGPLPPPGRVPAAFTRPVLAESRVRFVGEAVAVVLADTRARAVDAAEAVALDLDPLPAVADPLRALEEDAPRLFPEAGTNVAYERVWDPDPGALDGAEVVVSGRFVNQRVAPVPLEPNGILAVPEGDRVTVWVPHQAPFLFRDDLVKYLGLDPDRVRVVVPAVGGAFGAKAEAYPELLAVVALALRLGRPVRYVETRSENLVAMTHGRAQVQDVQLGARRDGTVTGLRVRLVADMGAYPKGTYLSGLTRMMAAGVYRIPRIDFGVRCVVTNATPIEQYRGAGRPEAAALLERAMDLLARELGMDPVEVRRRNLIPPEDFPHTTATGAVYDSGDYGRALDRALRLAGYEELRAEQEARRRRGDPRQLGVGVSLYVEVTAWGSEFGSVEVHPDGTATVVTGLSPHGQGHETALAQLVAGTLGLPLEAIRVVHSDTEAVPRGEGTMGSRSLQLGGSAALRAAEEVLDRARRVAAHVLEASPEDLAVFPEGGGGVGVAGAPETAISWGELAAIASDPGRRPEGLEGGLAASADFDMSKRNTYPFGAHVAVVEVDTETGQARLVRHVAVDDCGRILNPLLVDGQVHGGVAQGAAQALLEEVVYDEEGNPLTATLASYEVPGPADLPSFETAHPETPTTLNPLGAKGIGEAATVGSTPAVQSAVIDAVAHLGVTHVDMPLSPERVWRAVREASRASMASRASR